MSSRGSKTAARPASSAESAADSRDAADHAVLPPVGSPRLVKITAVALFVWYFILLLLAWHG